MTFLRITLLIAFLIPIANNAYAQVWSNPIALPGSYTGDVAFLPDGSLVFDTDKIYISRDSLRSYSVFVDQGANRLWVDGERLYWADSCCDGGVFRRNTDGSTTHLLQEINIETVWASANVIVAGGNAGQVFRSTNGGASWETANPDMLYRDDSRVARYLENALGVIYTQDTYPNRLMAIQSGNWIHVTTMDPEDLQLDETTDDFLIASDQGIYRSGQGLFWEPISIVPSGYSSIRTFDKRANVIVAVASNNVYLSSDSGLSWSEITDNLLDPYVDVIRIGPDNHIYAFSDNVVQRSQNPVFATSGVPVVEDPDTPTEMALHGVFPNPTSRELTLDLISYSGEFAEFTVVNTLGQVVHSERFGKPKMGSFRYHMMLPLLPSGTYYVRYTSGASSATKSFVIVR